MPVSVNRSILGLALQPTATLVAPSVFLPVTSISPKDTVTQLIDKAWRGSMVDAYDVQAGMISSEVSFDGDVYLDTIGYLLAGIFGDLTDSGSSAPYTHKFALLNSGQGQPVAQTITDFYAAGTRQYGNAMYSELSFKLSPDALLTYSAKAVSFGSTTTTQPTPTYSSVEPSVGWQGVVTIGGSVYAEMTDAQIDIKRTVTPIKTINNSQSPFTIWAGPMSVEGKGTLVMENDTYLTDYLNATKTSIDFTFTQSTGNSLEFHSSKINLSAANIQRGKDYIELPISFKCYGNSTDIGTSAGYSPMLVTLTNSIATGVY